jgi:soluble P-type ATPase
MTYDVPGLGEVEFKTVILDLNGTLTVGGVVPEGLKERLVRLKEGGWRLIFFTGNTRGDADTIAAELGLEWKQAETTEAKAELAKDLEPASCVAIGNGLIDLELMKVVGLRLAVMQAEGLHVQTLIASDAVFPHINDALDLLLEPSRLIATFRQ